MTISELFLFADVICQGTHPLAVVSVSMVDDLVTVTVSFHRLSPPPTPVRHQFTLEPIDHVRPLGQIAADILRLYKQVTA